MKTKVLTGSKQEIAEQVARLDGDVREAIVFLSEPSDAGEEHPVEDIFAEMEPFMVKVDQFDCSRESIYQRMEGE